MNAAEFLRKIKKVADDKQLPLRIRSRGKGGHQTIYLGDNLTVIAQHGKSKDLSRGTVAGMLKQLGLTLDDIEE